MKQYPYRLEVLLIPEATQDSDGNIVGGDPVWTFICNCRDEAGGGKKIALSGGMAREYSFLIQMPKSIPAIDPGMQVRIMEGDQMRATGEVIYSRKDQFHTRAWV